MRTYYTSAMALRIKELRDLAGLSQALLAKKAGLSRSQLSEIETEAKPANTRRLNAIATALGVQVEELFEIQDERVALLAELASIMRKLSDADKEALIRTAKGMAKGS